MTVITADAPETLAQRVVRGVSVNELLFRRWLATMLDLVLLAGALWAAVYGGVFVFGAPAMPAAIYGWLALAIAYHPLTEGLWGHTLGKYAAGLTVIDEAGRPPGLMRAAIRGFVRILELNPLLAALPAIAAVALTRDRQRLGDIAAETFVAPTEALIRALNDPAAVFD